MATRSGLTWQEPRRTRARDEAQPVEDMRMGDLLDALSVPRTGKFARSTPSKRLRKNKGGASFWTRNPEDLDWMLAEIFTCYQRLLRRLHLAAPGGRSREAERVVKVWCKVERLFELHGIRL